MIYGKSIKRKFTPNCVVGAAIATMYSSLEETRPGGSEEATFAQVVATT